MDFSSGERASPQPGSLSKVQMGVTLVVANSASFLRFDKSPHATIQFFDFATTKVTPIWFFIKGPDGSHLSSGKVEELNSCMRRLVEPQEGCRICVGVPV